MLILAILIFIASLYTDVDARDRNQVRIFRKANPGPATGQRIGPCRGWVIDHIEPLCLGGADDPVNMQWQELQESYRKDAEERAACARQKK